MLVMSHDKLSWSESLCEPGWKFLYMRYVAIELIGVGEIFICE